VPDPGFDALVGQVLAGRFSVIRVIGRTAVGILYEVQHQETHRKLTLEKLGLPLKDDPEAFVRFRHDADVVAKLHHPNIAEIVEWQTLEDGSRCLAMERPEGEDLATRMKKGVPPWSMVSAVAEQVLTALEVAHQAGVIHGALTPQHIFLAREPDGRERCKLHGFGVSRIWHLYPHPSFVEERIEAAFYLSPEHAQGKTGELGPASDCFSFASILFELVSSKQPFSAASAGAIVYKIGHGQADSVLQHRPDAPPALDKVLSRAWERDRERRLTAPALREELLAVLSSAQFLAGSAEIRVQSQAVTAPSALLLPEPLPDTAPNDETRQPILSAQSSPAALRQRRWFLPAVGGTAALLLLLIVLIARKASPPPLLPAPAPAVAAPPAAEPPVAPPAAEPPVAPPAAEPPVAPPPEPAVAPPTPDAVDDDAPKKHRKHHHHSSSSKTSSRTHKSKDAPKPPSKKTRETEM
jgi:serine/threonine-protein kinase